jgi:cyclophilin family peptidyl-prolyl cis-trans isomerase/glutaredoxin
MKKHHRTLAQRTIDSLKKIWNRRLRTDRNEDNRGRRSSFLFEPLENRSLMAGDLDLYPGDPGYANDNTAGITSAPPSAGEASVVANDLVAFAKLLTAAGVKFYGAAWCPHCTATKNLFEDGAKYLPFIEVTNPDKTPNAIAIANNITTYPTWEFQDGTRLTGERTLEEISAAAGIPIPQSSMPYLAELPDVTLLGGSPLMIGLDGYDPNGGPLTYTVTSDNPSLVTPTVFTGNQSLKINVNGYGTMIFHLFDNYVPRVTEYIKDLVNSGFYNNNATTFHRVINDFVIQGGDPTGTGAGRPDPNDIFHFDDQFHVDLQHNRSGLLSMAKSTDDTNDSQFFITEEKNETWHVTLNGSPTGGTFTLTYRGQTTAPIPFNSNGDFNTIAANIQTALANLTTIGAGNVSVTHDPVKNGAGQVTENRRFKIEFVNELGHRDLMPITGNASGLTGGSNVSLSFVEGPRSARHLDFNHSIFGALVEGEAVREAISNVPVGANDKPISNVTIGSMEVFNDIENGMLMLKAPEGASGSANITVTVRDGDNQVFTRTFRVDVRPDYKNGAPFLADIDTIHVTPNTPKTFNIQATDVEGDPIYYEAVKPDGVTDQYELTVNHETGAVTITPKAGFVGQTKVLIGVRGQTATDTGDTFDSQLVTINVAPESTLSVDLAAASDTGSSNTDNITNAQTLSFVISGVTSGATVKLYNGNSLIGQAVASGTTATVTTAALTSLGSGTYQISATQTINNAESEKSPVLSVTLDLTPPGAITSEAPTTATVDETYTYDVQSPDESNVTYSLESGAPANMTINPTTGVVSWTPTASQVGQQTFTVIATDVAGNSVNQTVSVTVEAATPKDIELILRIVDADGNVLTNLTTGQEFFIEGYVSDTRPEGESPLAGVFSFFADITYSTNIELNGSIQRTTYSNQATGSTSTPGLFDELGGIAGVTALGRGEFLLFRAPMKVVGSGTITVESNPHETEGLEIGLYGATVPTTPDKIKYGTTSATINSNITAVTDQVNFDEDSTNNVINALANDIVTGGSNSELIITAVGPTSGGGTVTISQDGKTLIYTPAPNFEGLDTFTYTVSRGVGGETATGTVNVSVQPVNDPPTAVDDTKTVNEDSTENSIDVLANDLISPDLNDTLVVSAVTQGSHGGTVTIGPGGNTVRYTPAPNFVGTETFTYTVTDSGGLTDTATVTVTVVDVNDNPTAAPDTATTTEDIETPITIDVLANDSGDPGETLTVTSVGSASHGGTVAVAAGGTAVTYKPAPNFQGTETFTYTISDGNGGTATGTVTVTVTNVNDPPVAVNDSATGFKNSTTTIDVLANDTSGVDPAETLIVSAVTQGSAGGTVTITNGGASVQYTPANNFTGTETFTYTIQDPGGLTSTATVTVTVANYAPSSLSGFVYKTSSDTSPLAGVTITLEGTDTNGATVNRTTKTDANGAYKFDSLLPGTYKIKETQPDFMADGEDVIGTQGGTVANDEFTITLTEGMHGTGNNFHEAGILPVVGSGSTTTFTLRKSDLFAHNSTNYILAAVNTSTGHVWYSEVGSTFVDTSTQTSFAVNNPSSADTPRMLTIQTKTSDGEQHVATVSTNDAAVRMLAANGDVLLYRIRGNSSFYNFTPMSSSSSSTNNNSAGEFVDPQHAQATDALMAMLAAEDDDDNDGNDAN